MQKKLLIIGAALSVIAVILGAMGAHYLESKVGDGILSEKNIKSFETGVRYQFYHAFALMLLSLFSEKLSKKHLKISAYLFLTGIVLFCGSIYLLSTKNMSGLENISWLGPITPLGGLSFIGGWLFLIISTFKLKL